MSSWLCVKMPISAIWQKYIYFHFIHPTEPGTGGAFLYQGNRTKTMTALYERYLGCAAFHPTDDNIVFIIGGMNENGASMKTNFKVHLDDESHHNLKDLDYTLRYHTCMGFVKKDGRPVSFF